MSVARLPSRPKLPALPGSTFRPQAKRGDAPSHTPDTDEFGLSWAIYERVPRPVRQRVAVALEAFNIPKNVDPKPYFPAGSGTIPELCMIGLLEEAGYHYPDDFAYQEPVLGGRENLFGGAVVDIVLHRRPREVGIFVESIWHSSHAPHGGSGAKQQEDERRNVRLVTQGSLDVLVRVNLASQLFPLEHGPEILMLQDLRRVLAA